MERLAKPIRTATDVARRHAGPMALLAAFLLLVWAPLYPPSKLATHLHEGDAMGNCHLVNWGQHILWRAPWRYLDVPLLLPQEHAKAHTETNPLAELATAPLRVFGNPVLAYNVAMLATAMASAMSAYAVAHAVTRHRRASVLAGAVFGGNGFMTWHLWGHPNVVSPVFVAPALWFAWKARRSDAIGWPLLAAAAIVAQYLCSLYLGVVASIGLAAFLAGDFAFGGAKGPRRRELRLLGALAVAHAMAVAPALPYRAMEERLGQSRDLGQAALFAASPAGYVLPAWNPDGPLTWAGRLVAASAEHPHRLEDASFAGWMPLALAAVAIVVLARRRRSELRGWFAGLGAAAAVGFALSLGPFLWLDGKPSIAMPYRFLYDWFPPVRFFRATARFAILPLLFTSVASAWALSRWAAFSGPNRTVRFGAFAVAMAILALEYRPVSAPRLVEIPREAAVALRDTEHLGMAAPWPPDDRRFLAAAAVDFAPTIAGTGVGTMNWHRMQVDEALSIPFGEALLARYAALGVGRLWVQDESRVAAVEASGLCRTVARWPGGAVFALPGLPDATVRKWRSEFAELPERPPLPSDDLLPPGFEPWRPVRWIAPDPATDNWRELTDGSPVDVPYRCIELRDSLGAVGNGESMADVGRVAVRFRHRQRGLDFAEVRMEWITRENPELAGAPVVRGWARGDAEWQTVVFDLSGHSRWRPDEHLAGLFMALPHGTYPGLEIQISNLATAPGPGLETGR